MNNLPVNAEFWAEISPCEHLVQFYEGDVSLLDSLAGFVAGGLRLGEGVILILTPAHRDALEDRLLDYETLGHFCLSAARSRDQYITLDANETLASFLINGRINEGLFRSIVGDLLTRARAVGWWGGDGRPVRAFGEMVAILWKQGERQATLELERLWNDLCRQERFSLFCAYPKAGFSNDAMSAAEICAAHSHVIAN